MAYHKKKKGGEPRKLASVTTPSPKKVPLKIPELPEPWSAIQHQGRENRIYFYNRESKECVWEDEFRRNYGHLMRRWPNLPKGPVRDAHHPTPAEALKKIKKKTRIGNAEKKTKELRVDECEPMEVDLELCNHEVQQLRSHKMNYLPVQDAVYKSFLSDARDGTDIPSTSDVIAVFDTNVLLHDMKIIPRSGEAGVFVRIPYTVLQELDGLKKRESLRVVVNEVHKDMEKLKKEKPFLMSFEKRADMNAQLFQTATSGEVTSFTARTCDDYIIKAALFMKQRAGHRNLVLVTNDYNMRIKAMADDINPMSGTDFLSLLDSVRNQKKALPKPPSPEIAPPKKIFFPDPPVKQKPSTPPLVSNAPMAPTPSFIALDESRNSRNPIRYSINRPEPRKRSPRSTCAFWFQNESLKFAYILESAKKYAVDKIGGKRENYEEVHQAVAKLGNAYASFLNGYDQDKFREAIKLTEDLYDVSVIRLNTMQRFAMEKIEAEVKAGGKDCPCIQKIREFLEFLCKEGWRPT